MIHLSVLQIQLWKRSRPTEDSFTGFSDSLDTGWTVQPVITQKPMEQAKGSPTSVEPASIAPVSLAFSGCGQYLAVADGSQGGVRMWDVLSMHKALVQSPRDGKVSCIAWNNDRSSSEQILACGSTCGDVFMYGISVHGIPRLLHRRAAHRPPIVCLQFLGAPSDSKLLSCDSDGHVVCTNWCACLPLLVELLQMLHCASYRTSEHVFA
jgi:WD40 repeat protein